MINIFRDSDIQSLGNQGDQTLINRFFTPEMIKALFYHCCRVDIADNNDKAEIVKVILKSPEYIELGTGTNRMTFLHNGFAIKLALDRRG